MLRFPFINNKLKNISGKPFQFGILVYMDKKTKPIILLPQPSTDGGLLKLKVGVFLHLGLVLTYTRTGHSIADIGFTLGPLSSRSWLPSNIIMPTFIPMFWDNFNYNSFIICRGSNVKHTYSKS